ncbi:SidA/IucD/PvdA family monooxygenase (plasmid) [Thioclava sp. 'Guangxiensis']|uniref:lysine N(6)-hydroxylase/L-ornithine N(5)-oxygenase family protein n=1 Tax=Thioclava sp. 'Guangxiensis' TaxID=3149044 RepID=UPI0032C43064
MTSHDSEFDLIGMGFGPSNLALAVALHERNAGLRTRFLEARPQFAWHPEMMIEGADMQVSFLKDLVSQRNPQSAFSFVAYLHAKGRLGRFINRKTFFPSRVEFNDYLAWVAGQLPVCTYDRKVVGLAPVKRHGRIDAVSVIAEDRQGRQWAETARNLILAPGGQPRWPAAIEALRDDPRVIHSRDYLSRALPRLKPGMRVAVIGGGQSGAEIFDDLASRPEAPRIDLVLRATALRPSDDTPFVNEIFDPAGTDRFHARSETERHETLRALAATNYSVADADLIERLYDRLYEQSVTGEDRLGVHPEQRLTGAHRRQNGVVLAFAGPQGPKEIAADLVILATGFERRIDGRLLGDLAPHWTGDLPDRSYRLPMENGFAPGIFVQGFSESTHGLSDTLLSVLALRADELAQSLIGLAQARRHSLAAE